MVAVSAYGAKSAQSPLEDMTIERRALGPLDVDIAVRYCGVCHSDLHSARNDWGGTRYPVVPGHEIIGEVLAVGDDVSKHRVGDMVAVGCLVGSCHHCAACDDHLEQYCEGGLIGTYGSNDIYHSNEMTYGGYSERMVVDQHFVMSVPDKLNPAAAAPLLCAGITTWSPLRHWNVSAGDQVAVVGLGGLGHMGVKFAHALGAEVTMVTTSMAKADDARKLGADHVLLSTDPEAMKAAANRFDFILNTIPVDHDINPYVGLLKRDGTMCIVGALMPLQQPLNTGAIIMGRRSVAGSIIGGIKETQEMLEFCAEHNILPEIEMINMQDINDAYERMLKGDVKYRFVIDMASLQAK